MSTQEAATSGANTSSKKVAISTGLLALALGSGLGATPAEATLITQQLNVDVQVGKTADFGPSTPPFPVADPGEFTIFNSGPSGPFLTTIFLQGNTTSLSKNFVATSGVKPGTSDPLLQFFHAGDVIDGSLDFSKTQGEDNFFKPANNVIYGLETLGKDDPWGFVQLDVLPSGDLHLDLFAFQDTPGQPVVVVPEPGTLSLFAVGGAALLAARRRKKKQKTA